MSISPAKLVPLAEILNNPLNAEQLAKHRKNASSRIALFARLPRETATPIWIDSKGKILDGHHRVLAGEARGDSEILVCVIRLKAVQKVN